jgi:hypothetical protein
VILSTSVTIDYPAETTPNRSGVTWVTIIAGIAHAGRRLEQMSV